MCRTMRPGHRLRYHRMTCCRSGKQSPRLTPWLPEGLLSVTVPHRLCRCRRWVRWRMARALVISATTPSRRPAVGTARSAARATSLTSVVAAATAAQARKPGAASASASGRSSSSSSSTSSRRTLGTRSNSNSSPRSPQRSRRRRRDAAPRPAGARPRTLRGLRGCGRSRRARSKSGGTSSSCCGSSSNDICGHCGGRGHTDGFDQGRRLRFDTRQGPGGRCGGCNSGSAGLFLFKPQYAVHPALAPTGAALHAALVDMGGKAAMHGPAPRTA